jgi:hypothetical protein
VPEQAPAFGHLLANGSMKPHVLKNKTTKTGFVVELHMFISNVLSSLYIRYFFLVVFFAFFAGAFFVAMYTSPPFLCGFRIE